MQQPTNNKSSLLPNEIIAAIVERLPRGKLPTAGRVNKEWGKIVKKQIFGKVIFSSLKERDGFFNVLTIARGKQTAEQRGSAPSTLGSRRGSTSSARRNSTSSTSSRRDSISPTRPPPVSIARRASLRLNNEPSELAKLVKSLDFGFQIRQKQPSLTGTEVDIDGDVTNNNVQQTPLRLVIPTGGSSSSTLNLTSSSLNLTNSPTNTSSTSSASSRSLSLSPSSPLSYSSSTKRYNASPVRGFSSPSSSTSLSSPTRRLALADNQRGPTSESYSLRRREGNSIGSVSPDKTNINRGKSYSDWGNRFVSPLISQVGDLLPHLTELSIAGCVVNFEEFSSMLQALRCLARLDISFSTVKTEGIELIARFCRFKLTWLNISGIFKFGRNKQQSILAVCNHCEALSVIVALDCPELYQSTIQKCLEVSRGEEVGLKILTDQGSFKS